MLQQQSKNQVTHITIQLLATVLMVKINKVESLVFPRGDSFGYLAAVAMPLDLPNRNVYMAFNFESNYGLPTNDSYNEWIERWDIDEQFVGIGNNVTHINNRRKKRSPFLPAPPYDRHSFYRSFVGYLDHFQMNGTGCLLRTICEVAASTLHENNGVLGSLFKVLFMPTTSQPETSPLHHNIADIDLYRAEWQGRRYLANNHVEGEHNEYDEPQHSANACMAYTDWCPEGVINMISSWY